MDKKRKWNGEGLLIKQINSLFTMHYFSYAEHLKDARKVGIRKAFISGLGFGVNFLVMFGILGLAYW